jgi:hypothetical protein
MSWSFAIRAGFVLGALPWVLIVTWKALDAWASMPTVEVSHSTGHCERVIEYVEPKRGYSCENLPNKYDHVWVR